MITDIAPGLHALSATQLALDIDRRGVVTISDAFSARWLGDVRAAVNDVVEHDQTGADLYLDDLGHEPDSPELQLVSNPLLRQLLAATASLRQPLCGVAEADCLRTSMLVRHGTGPAAPSGMFHYDPCVLTMVVPVFIPQTTLGQGGELVAWGNKRCVRRHEAMHLPGKIATHNPLYRNNFRRRVHRHPDRYIVPLHPGDAVFFWGNRTYHGNLSCAPGLLRATLVVKYGPTNATSNWMATAAWKLSPSHRHLKQLQQPAIS